jgi:hypothetical protein
MTAEVHIGDTGTLVKATISNEGGVMDLTSASEKVFLFKKKTKEVIERTASYFTSGSDGILVYTSGSGDFDVKGMWELQVRVTLPSGRWHTDTQKFEVAERFIPTI